MSRSDIAELPLSLPPLTEQRRIAAILDKADALRHRRKRAIDLLDTLTQSIFLEMFNPESLSNGLNRKVQLGDICELIRDGAHKTPTYVESGVPFVTVKNIVSGTLDLSQTKFVSEQEHRELTRRAKPEEGDILVSKDGTIGVPCIVPRGLNFSIFVSVALLKTKRKLVDPQFLVEQIRSPGVQKQIRDASKGIAIRHLHLNDFAKLKINLPTIMEQKRFSNLADQVETKRNAATLALLGADSLFSSLQHRAFSGQL